MAFLKFTPTASAYTAAVHIRADAIISVDERADLPGSRVQTAAGGYDVTESPDAILAAIADASGGAVDEVTDEMVEAAKAAFMDVDGPAHESPLSYSLRAALEAALALRARRQP